MTITKNSEIEDMNYTDYKEKVYFVVLHYLAIEETIDCVESLKRLSQQEIKVYIIIVDNASPNGTGKKLIDKYINDEQVHVILNHENSGFAKGNNVGFNAAKKAGADYIALINNDTLIKDKMFASKIRHIYHETKYGVLGPDILSISDGIHQNPMNGFALNVKAINKKIIKAKIILIANKFGFTEFLLKKKNVNKVFDSLRIVTQVYKYSKEKFNLFAVLLVLSYGFFAGHLWSGGVSGLYFALFIIYFTKMIKISFH